MKKEFFTRALVSLSSLAFLCMAGLSAYAEEAAKPVAEQAIGQLLTVSDGSILLRAGAQLDKAPQTHIRAGDTLRTDGQGRAQILLADGGTLLLAANTNLTFINTQPLLQLDAGLIRLTTGKPASIHTPHAKINMDAGIVSVHVEDDTKSTVYVENAVKPVQVNGEEIRQGYQLTLPIRR